MNKFDWYLSGKELDKNMKVFIQKQWNDLLKEIQSR